MRTRSPPPHEPLAVKLLRADLAADERVLERFLKERATLMRVRSPHVVGVRDMVVEGATFAIVMSYVGGGICGAAVHHRTARAG
ncbi:protein kinase [Actinomyces gaoshouyii]|uniref:protein kinase n=1 Tax=Actinomyces gaoshouyii TaxID=1960083 RepID=UPI001F0B1BD1|nr:protein kinase [Actinomyces gaoshouyii]